MTNLAECYLADAEYTPGTVVVFGGANEVTIANRPGDPRVAGVVTAEPAYLINSFLPGQPVLSVALAGRVQCQVHGTIALGDCLVTGTVPGVAVRLDPSVYQPGCVIGKALANYDSVTVGTIAVAVGRV